MKQSQQFIQNADNCAELAERAADQPTYHRYKRMEAAWRALAEEQDWLDGEVPPERIATGSTKKSRPSEAAVSLKIPQRRACFVRDAHTLSVKRAARADRSPRHDDQIKEGANRGD